MKKLLETLPLRFCFKAAHVPATQMSKPMASNLRFPLISMSGLNNGKYKLEDVFPIYTNRKKLTGKIMMASPITLKRDTNPDYPKMHLTMENLNRYYIHII